MEHQHPLVDSFLHSHMEILRETRKKTQTKVSPATRASFLDISRFCLGFRPWKMFQNSQVCLGQREKAEMNHWTTSCSLPSINSPVDGFRHRSRIKVDAENSDRSLRDLHMHVQKLFFP